MIKSKIAIIVSLILLVSGGFIALDLVKVPSLVLKGVIVFLTSLLVFVINKDALSKKDTNLLKIIYILIILADISLVLFKKSYTGIILFSFAQCFIIYRNCGYIYRRYSVKEIVDKYNILFLLILSIMLVLYLIFIRQYTSDSFLFILFIFYGIIKSSSVFSAILSFRFKVFPKINGLLLLLGIICFYLCDLNVGLSMVLKEGLVRDISSILIWIFYTPALSLIALSGYDRAFVI